MRSVDLFSRYFQFFRQLTQDTEPTDKESNFLSQRNCFKNASQLEHFKSALTGKKGEQLLRIKVNENKQQSSGAGSLACFSYTRY